MAMESPGMVAEGAIDVASGIPIEPCIVGMPTAAPATSIAHAANAMVNTRRDRQKRVKAGRCMEAI